MSNTNPQSSYCYISFHLELFDKSPQNLVASNQSTLSQFLGVRNSGVT